MLPGGADPFYRNVLSAGHHHYVRVEVWSSNGVQLQTFIPQQFYGDPEGGLAIFSGSLSATLDSRVARQISFAVHPDLYPRDESGLLAPFGNEVRAYAGVTLGDGSDKYVWQVFRGRIRSVTKDSSGSCTVHCSDRANDVLDVAFEVPENSQPGAGVVSEFQRLIIDAVPGATFGASDTYTELIRALTWEFSRGSALDEVALSVASLWYPLANGDFVMRRIPWTVPTAPVLTLTDQTGGTINGWTRARNRDAMFNVVTVTGERLNGDAPVHATARDTSPTSPTFYQGNFGVKSTVQRLQTPGTQGSAQTTAESLLRTFIASVEDWGLEMVMDASLELGDVLLLQVDSSEVIQVVESFTLPLDLSGSMNVSTRSLVIGGA